MLHARGNCPKKILSTAVSTSIARVKASRTFWSANTPLRSLRNSEYGSPGTCTDFTDAEPLTWETRFGGSCEARSISPDDTEPLRTEASGRICTRRVLKDGAFSPSGAHAYFVLRV